MKQIQLKFEEMRATIMSAVEETTIELDDAIAQIEKIDADEAAEIAEFLAQLAATQKANDAKETELEKAVSAACKGMMASTPENLMANYNVKVAAEKALRDFKLSIMTEDEIKAQEAYMEAEIAYEEAKKALNAAKDELSKYKKVSVPKAATSTPSGERKVSVGPPPAATIKANMDLIISMAKEGKGVTEIGKALGFTKEQGYCGNSIRPLIIAFRPA